MTPKAPSVAPINLRPLGGAPLVSVVITSYNYEEFISDALNSVLGQDYPNLEIIVADDGSRDRTPEIVRLFESRDSRVRLLPGVNLGQPRNTSRGYAATSGDVICFLDADDAFAPGKVSAVVEAFRRSPDCGLCLHRVQKVDVHGRPFGAPVPRDIETGWLLESILCNGGRWLFAGPFGSAMALRREVAERIFPIRANALRVGDAYIQYPAACLTSICVAPGTYAIYRRHGRNMSSTGTSVLEQLKGQLAEFEDVFSTNREFVRRELGDEFANRMALMDSREVLQRAASYLLLSGDAGYNGLSIHEIVRRMPGGAIRSMWNLLLALPSPMAKQFFLLRRRTAESWTAVRSAVPYRRKLKFCAALECRSSAGVSCS